MQAGHVLGRAPVAPVKRVAACKVQRGRHRLAVALRQDQHESVRKCAMRAAEELLVQVGRIAMAEVGAAIAFIEEVQFGRADFGATQPAVGQPGGGHLLAVLADFLALVMAHRGQERVEVRVAGIGPVELHAFADHEPGFAQRAHVRIRGKKQMQRRNLDLFGKGDQPAHQGVAILVVARQQPGAGHRGEWNRGQQLGVVAQAVALEGVGPRVVENILTARVRLQVERGGGSQRMVSPQRKIMRRPAGAWRGAAGFMQRAQERMAQEGLLARQRVPLLGVDAGQVGLYGQAQGIHG